VWHIIVVVAAVIVATVGAAASVSATEPEETETAGTVDTCDGGTMRLDAKDARTLELHNPERKSEGRRPLCVHLKLTKAARAHSADMLSKDYFAHGNVERRLKRVDYRWITYGENIGMGSGSRGSPESVFRAWMNSRGHKANILDRDFREIGIGVATGTYRGADGVSMYTVDFGARRQGRG
jgi:uncharacterized protein YkwD